MILDMLDLLGTTLTNAGLAIIDYVVGTKQEFEGLARVGAGLTGDLDTTMTAAETPCPNQFAKMVKTTVHCCPQFGGGMTDSVKKFGVSSDAMFQRRTSTKHVYAFRHDPLKNSMNLCYRH